jgi:hypothetical protein
MALGGGRIAVLNDTVFSVDRYTPENGKQAEG